MIRTNAFASFVPHIRVLANASAASARHILAIVGQCLSASGRLTSGRQASGVGPSLVLSATVLFLVWAQVPWNAAAILVPGVSPFADASVILALSIAMTTFVITFASLLAFGRAAAVFFVAAAFVLSAIAFVSALCWQNAFAVIVLQVSVVATASLGAAGGIGARTRIRIAAGRIAGGALAETLVRFEAAVKSSSKSNKAKK